MCVSRVRFGLISGAILVDFGVHFRSFWVHFVGEFRNSGKVDFAGRHNEFHCFLSEFWHFSVPNWSQNVLKMRIDVLIDFGMDFRPHFGRFWDHFGSQNGPKVASKIV